MAHHATKETPEVKRPEEHLAHHAAKETPEVKKPQEQLRSPMSISSSDSRKGQDMRSPLSPDKGSRRSSGSFMDSRTTTMNEFKLDISSYEFLPTENPLPRGQSRAPTFMSIPTQYSKAETWRTGRSEKARCRALRQDELEAAMQKICQDRANMETDEDSRSDSESSCSTERDAADFDSSRAGTFDLGYRPLGEGPLSDVVSWGRPSYERLSHEGASNGMRPSYERTSHEREDPVSPFLLNPHVWQDPKTPWYSAAGCSRHRDAVNDTATDHPLTNSGYSLPPVSERSHSSHSLPKLKPNSKEFRGQLMINSNPPSYHTMPPIESHTEEHGEDDADSKDANLSDVDSLIVGFDLCDSSPQAKPNEALLKNQGSAKASPSPHQRRRSSLLSYFLPKKNAKTPASVPAYPRNHTRKEAPGEKRRLSLFQKVSRLSTRSKPNDGYSDGFDSLGPS